MAKASAPGRTKTRLVPPLTFDEAAQFNTAFLKDVAANLLAANLLAANLLASHSPASEVTASIRGYMAYGPPGTERFFVDNMPADIGRLEAWYPNFGDCLFAAITGMFAAGHGSAVVLNADSPTLPTRLLAETARLLAEDGDHAVLGPSNDGGYYLLGIKSAHRRLFDDIDWSTERVFAQTLERAREIGLRVHILPEWYDVDDVGALRLLNDELFAGRSFGSGMLPHHAVHTQALMRRLFVASDLASRLGLPAPAMKDQVSA